MRHRADIDGLRAIAVVPVVLFHAGVSQVSGGFVGVDIFFVISGYLITSLILGEMAEGRFSLLSFYERRIRRIFPALFLVLAVSSVLALRLFMPPDLVAFGRSLVATALFVSNMHFYGDSGYFAAALDTKPLLHTWSLAIEEQFYIVFPLLLLLAVRWGGRRWIGVVLALFALSLAASIRITPVDPDAAFYLAPTRAWELLLGALLASGIVPSVKFPVLREALAVVGLALIVYAVFHFSSATPFPGSSALIPCLGAALLIYAGRGERTSMVSKALGLWPLAFVGLISYSLYLWHWPLLVFAHYYNIRALSGAQAASIVIASFVLAVLSWAYVEQPFRRKPIGISREMLFAGAATAIVSFIVSGTLDVRTKGFPGRLPPEALAIADTAETPDTYGALQKSCNSMRPDNPCVAGAQVTSSYALWGDSHAIAMVPALAEMAERHGKSIKIFVAKGCPPVFGVHRNGRFAGCYARSSEVMRAIEAAPEIESVILISRYAQYIYGNMRPTGPNGTEGLIAGESGEELDLTARSNVFERQLHLTVRRLLAAGKRVILVYPVPEIGFSVPPTLSRLVAMGRDPAGFNLPRADFEGREKIVFSILDRVDPSPQLVRIWPHKRLCNSVRCLIVADGKALYRDEDHLSRAGANFLMPEFEPIFADHNPPTASAGVTSALAESTSSPSR